MKEEKQRAWKDGCAEVFKTARGGRQVPSPARQFVARLAMERPCAAGRKGVACSLATVGAGGGHHSVIFGFKSLVRN